MALRCGIVGLPNVGKSTLFNALTAAENYPFCTVDPNTGVVPVPDPRLQALDAFVHAPQAAAEIHSDFEKHFIRAEAIGYEDFIIAGGETAAKAGGKMRVECKDTVVQDGDVVYFRVSA